MKQRDTTKLDTQQGLFAKFDVTRLDGSSEPGEKHHGCNYFVLDCDHDPYAKAALMAYALACSDTHPYLARDILSMPNLGLPHARYVLVRPDPTDPAGYVEFKLGALLGHWTNENIADTNSSYTRHDAEIFMRNGYWKLWT